MSSGEPAQQPESKKREAGEMAEQPAPKKRRGGRNKGRGRRRKADNRPKEYQEAVYENAAFEEYYRAQRVVPGQGSDEEWKPFFESLKVPLNTTWRVNATSPVAASVLKRLEEGDRFGLGAGGAARERLVREDGKVAEPLVPISWYPRGHAFSIGCGRRDLRHIGRTVAEIKPFREFLVAMDRVGAINRQEAVSMIPPLLLDVQPHHRVLDMCAAPGSKTAQIVSALHGDLVGNQQLEAAPPTGFVMANDTDTKRAYMLSHQLKRLCTGANVVVTHDARRFPMPMRPATAEEAAETLREAAREAGEELDLAALEPARLAAAQRYLSRPAAFHRVLADVPCSGDGTMRKNLDLWRKWNHKMGPDLHPLQLAIAARGVELLEVGGLMCYSTCSLNPMENEAVVAELLRRFPGALEIVDCAGRLPGLLREPGLLTWRVRTTDAWYASRDEVPAELADKAFVAPSLFPPAGGEAESRRMGLDRCMRVLPHRQDTGGFFICLLRKTARTQGTEQAARTAAKRAKRALYLARNDVTAEEEAATAPNNGRAKAEMTYVPLPEDLRKSVADFFGLPPKFAAGRLALRRDGSNARVQLLSHDLADVLLSEHNARIKVVGGGVRVLDTVRERKSACPMRLTQEGINTMLPHVTKQLIRVKLDHLVHVLRLETLRLADLAEELREQLAAVHEGSVVLQLEDGVVNFPVAAVCWIATKSLVCMVSKEERGVLLGAVGDALGRDLGEAESAQAKAAAAKKKRAADEAAAAAAAAAATKPAEAEAEAEDKVME